VEQRGSGWWLRITENAAPGRQRRIALGAHTSRSAARAAADAWLARESGEIAAGPTVLGAQVFERFLKIDAHNVLPSSRRRYERLVRRFVIPKLGSHAARAITTAVLREWLAELAAAGVARSTLIGIRAITLQALRSAEADGIAMLGPLDTRRLKISRSATPPRPMQPVTAAELEQLLKASEWPWRALWAILGYAGLRIGEGLGLQWTDIDLAAGRLTIARAAADGKLVIPKTRGSAAEIPVLAPLEAVLADYRPAWRMNTAGLLFATRCSTPYRADDVRRRVWYPLLERLGLARRGFHQLRHGLPQQLFDLGLSADVVQRVMRHGSLAVTNRYSHRSDDLRTTINAALERRKGLSAPVASSAERPD